MKNEACRECFGSGKVWIYEDATCKCGNCHGTGRVPVGGTAWGTPDRDARCFECRGAGRVSSIARSRHT